MNLIACEACGRPIGYDPTDVLCAWCLDAPPVPQPAVELVKPAVVSIPVVVES